MSSQSQVTPSNEGQTAPAPTGTSPSTPGSTSTSAEIVSQFVVAFYQSLTESPDSLYSFYAEDAQSVRIDSSATSADSLWSSPTAVVGQVEIHRVSESLGPCGKIKISTVDHVQFDNGHKIHILVTGHVLRGNSLRAFTHTVLLSELGQANYSISSDILRFTVHPDEEFSSPNAQSLNANNTLSNEVANSTFTENTNVVDNGASAPVAQENETLINATENVHSTKSPVNSPVKKSKGGVASPVSESRRGRKRHEAEYEQSNAANNNVNEVAVPSIDVVRPEHTSVNQLESPTSSSLNNVKPAVEEVNNSVAPVQATPVTAAPQTSAPAPAAAPVPKQPNSWAALLGGNTSTNPSQLDKTITVSNLPSGWTRLDAHAYFSTIGQVNFSTIDSARNTATIVFVNTADVHKALSLTHTVAGSTLLLVSESQQPHRNNNSSGANFRSRGGRGRAPRASPTRPHNNNNNSNNGNNGPNANNNNERRAPGTDADGFVTKGRKNFNSNNNSGSNNNAPSGGRGGRGRGGNQSRGGGGGRSSRGGAAGAPNGNSFHQNGHAPVPAN